MAISPSGGESPNFGWAGFSGGVFTPHPEQVPPLLGRPSAVAISPSGGESPNSGWAGFSGVVFTARPEQVPTLPG